MAQRSVRFSDELHAAIEAEAERRGKPHTFSSVLQEAAARGLGMAGVDRAIDGALARGAIAPDHAAGLRDMARERAGDPMPLRRDVAPKPAAAFTPRPKGGKR